MLPKVKVVAGVIVKDGLLLCAKKGETAYDYTSWKYEFPGGKIQGEETPEQALKRELYEELELQVEVLEDLGMIDHTYPHLEVSLHFFLCTDKIHQPVAKEHVSLDWVQPKDLLHLDWTAADLPMVHLLQKRLI